MDPVPSTQTADVDTAHALGRTLLEEGGFARLSGEDQQLVCLLAHRIHETRDANAAFDAETTFGERLADRVAEVGGSWWFVSGFAVFLVVWASLNLLVLSGDNRFDPYPFIFLNLILSMLAAIQAPIIMMAQNRQSAKDRVSARLDFEVNVKSEHEITLLHQRLAAIDARLQQLLDNRA